MIADAGLIESIEASARAALPALAEHPAPGWVCRVSGGTTKRVNSANPVRDGATLEAVRATAERLYPAAGLPVRFRLTPLAEAGADAALAEAGYERVDRSLTMTAALTKDWAIDPAVTIAAAADETWCAGLAAATAWSAAEGVAHRALLSRLPPGSVVAAIDPGGGPVAFGVAGLGEGRLCLFDVAVAAEARDRGWGRRLVASLLGWGAVAGHREAILHVLADNAVARRLYASLGFVDAYPYHYRIAP